MEPTNHNDELVESYLGQVERLSLGLSPGTRQDLMQDLREHIAVQRAELAPETEASVRSILDRLGEPAAIVAAARENDPRPPHIDVAPVVLPPPHKGSNKAVIVVLSVVAAVVLGCVLVGVFGFLAFQPTRVDRGPAEVVTGYEAPTSSPS